MKLDNGTLTINCDDYGTINDMLHLIDNARMCNLMKHGNTCIGVYKIERIRGLLEENKIEQFCDETSGINDIDDEEGLLKELEAIIEYLSGINVMVFKSWYDHDILCPGDRDHIYLVWNTDDRYNLKSALHTNELIYRKNKHMKPRKMTKSDITHPYKMDW